MLINFSEHFMQNLEFQAQNVHRSPKIQNTRSQGRMQGGGQAASPLPVPT